MGAINFGGNTPRSLLIGWVYESVVNGTGDQFGAIETTAAAVQAAFMDVESKKYIAQTPSGQGKKRESFLLGVEFKGTPSQKKEKHMENHWAAGIEYMPQRCLDAG